MKSLLSHFLKRTIPAGFSLLTAVTPSWAILLVDGVMRGQTNSITGAQDYFESSGLQKWADNPQDAKLDASERRGSLSAGTRASADYGTLKVDGFAALKIGSNSSGSIESTGYAGWYDRLVISAPGQEGALGYASISFSVNGRLGATGYGSNNDSYAQNWTGIFLNFAGNYMRRDRRDYGTYSSNEIFLEYLSSSFGGCIDDGTTGCFEAFFPESFVADGDSILGTYNLLLPFTFNTESNLDLGLAGEVLIGAKTLDLGTGGYGGGEGFFDLGNSLYWGGINYITDANGIRISQFSVESASGTDYLKSYIPKSSEISEPPILPLALSAFGLAAFLARRKVGLEASKNVAS